MSKKFTDEQAEKAANSIKGSFHLEGIELDDFNMDLTRRLLKGEISSDEAISLVRERLIREGYIDS